MAIDTQAIKEHIRGILIALGDDPDREGLKDTPDRVARMYQEVFEGMQYTNREIAEMFDKTFEEEMDFVTDSRDMVIVRDIQLFSYCEHHIALMYDMTATVAYIPNGKVIGLQDRPHRRHGVQASAAAGAHRHGHRGDSADGHGFRGRRRTHRRLAQLHDCTRHSCDQRKNHDNHAARPLPHGPGITATAQGIRRES